MAGIRTYTKLLQRFLKLLENMKANIKKTEGSPIKVRSHTQGEMDNEYRISSLQSLRC